VIFAWDDANFSHLQKHGVTPAEAVYVVEHATPPFPQNIGDEKYRVWGPSAAGRMLQVIYVFKTMSDVAYESLTPMNWLELEETPGTEIVRIIHAMELTGDMKRQLRRRKR
jgi:uncharacterized DUF497 family protein